MSQEIQEIGDKNFEEMVMKSEKPVLLDFWAPWCGPCKTIGPILEQLVKKYDDSFVIGKCNIDNNPELPLKYGVKSIPTLMFFNGGELVDRITGAVGQGEIETVLEKMLSGEKLVSPLIVH